MKAVLMRHSVTHTVPTLNPYSVPTLFLPKFTSLLLNLASMQDGKFTGVRMLSRIKSSHS